MEVLYDDFDDFSDISIASLTRIANIGHAFAIPWNHEVQPLLRGFDSARIMDRNGPWVTNSPFEENEAKACTMCYESSNSSYTYREGESSQSHSSSEHMSFNLGVSVGPPFLSAEVSGKYDKTVLSNHNVSFVVLRYYR